MAGKTRQIVIDIEITIPSTNSYKTMHWAQQWALKQGAMARLKLWKAKSGIDKIPVPCRLSIDIHKRFVGTLDPQNYVYPLDKIVIDCLKAPGKPYIVKRGGRVMVNQVMGLDLVPDDSPRFLDIAMPRIHMGKLVDRVILTFKPKRGATLDGKPREKGAHAPKHVPYRRIRKGRPRVHRPEQEGGA